MANSLATQIEGLTSKGRATRQRISQIHRDTRPMEIALDTVIDHIASLTVRTPKGRGRSR
jgi:hypothetical protein